MRQYHISGKLPGANDYINACRRNRYAGAKLKEDTERLICMQICDRKPVDRAVRLRFTWHEGNRRRDKDNVAFAKKFILDALQKCGVLPNDNNLYIEGFEDVFEYGGDYGVEVMIYAAARDQSRA